MNCAKSEEKSEFGGSGFDSPESVPPGRNFVATPLVMVKGVNSAMLSLPNQVINRLETDADRISYLGTSRTNLE